MENDKTRSEAEAIDASTPEEPNLIPLGGQLLLGKIFITERAMDALTPDEVFRSLGSHSLGHWGDCYPTNREDYERRLRHGLRIYSQFDDSHGTMFWILTEHDRSKTIVFLPDELYASGTV